MDTNPQEEVVVTDYQSGQKQSQEPSQAPNQADRPTYTPGGYQPPYGGNMPPRPQNYLVWAILLTCFCCMPFGIVAIVNAANVDSRYNIGDYDGALRASRAAKNWSLAAGICGAVGWLLYIGFMIAMAFLGLAADEVSAWV